MESMRATSTDSAFLPQRQGKEVLASGARPGYFVSFAALILAQRALAALLIAAFAEALIVNFFGVAGLAVVAVVAPLILAQRAF